MKPEDYHAELARQRARFEKLVTIHKVQKSYLPKKRKSKKWALWLLEGASLSLANRALGQAEVNDNLGYLGMNLRLALEIRDYVEHFSQKPENAELQRMLSSHVVDWFTRFKDVLFNGADRMSYTAFKTSKWRNSEKQVANNLFSMYAHPSHELVKMIFEYSLKKGSLEYYSFSPHLDYHQSSLTTISLYVDIAEESITLASRILECE